ncbi:PEX11 family protein PWA37_000859 [Arxiozyma heterogenica]|uniref:PEX11 family protein n=1 Tax=Arxiozyma heterogenica TaxID=278026 RepID=UPI002EDF68C4
MVCDTFVYHPWITHLIKFLDTTAGREKLLRFLQYFSRLLSFSLNSVKARSLQLQFLLIRKVLRFLKPLNHIQLASRLYDNKLSNQDSLIRYSQIWRNIFLCLYLSLDQINLLRLLKILPYNNATISNNKNNKSNELIQFKISRWANYCWFFSILSGIVSDLKTIQNSDAELEYISSSTQNGNVSEKDKNDLEETKALISQIRDKKYTSTKKLLWDLLDCIIVLNNLNYLKSRDDIVGLSGMITSIFGIQDTWKTIK